VRWHRLAVLSGICFVALVQQASGQTAFPFQLSIQQGTSTSTIPNASTVNLVATGVGVATTFSFTATYVGTTSATISAAPQVLGSTDFTVSGISGLPLTLQPGASVTVQVTYKPSSNAGEVAQIGIAYTQAAASATGTATAGTIILTVDGSVPQFSVSYALQANSNIITLATGGTIQFLPTPVGSTANATVIVLNRGSGGGNVNTVAVTGTAFQPINLPLLPAGLASGGNLQFQIQYTPSAVGSSDTGGLSITFSDGTTFTAVIQGSGTGSSFAYTLINGSTTSSITPGQTITLPDIAIGQSESVMIQVQNTGNASGTINVISSAGSSFGLANLPGLPLTLAANATTSFTLTADPSQPGQASGTLRIGNDLFTLAVTGIGPNLVYSYVTAGTTTTVQPGGSVLFSPLSVSQTASLPFTVSNTGTSAALIATIGISGSSSSPFTLTGLPPLPMNLQAGAAITFTINFTPTSTGQATASLLVNAQSFSLLGFGNQPPALPAYQLVGPSGSIGPSQQPTIGLTLSQAYPLNLAGTLTIQVTSNAFAADPAIQFSTGGVTVAFTIPAGQTQAIFPNGSTSIRFQTGTVAGGIAITPTFATTTGLDLTPANPTQLQLTVPSQAPVLLTAAISSQSATGFIVTVSGYVTSRSVTSLNYTFSVTSGVTSTTSTFSLNVSQASSIWFNSSTSTAFGGQFSIAVPFTLQATGGAVATTALQSVAVTATNAVGVSNSVSGSFP
jgi:hypothetical protein